jgi:hypothetical protein
MSVLGRTVLIFQVAKKLCLMMDVRRLMQGNKKGKAIRTISRLVNWDVLILFRTVALKRKVGGHKLR